VITAYLSLGSNLGDRERRLHDALEILEDDRLRVTRVSRIYETEPVGAGYAGEPWFLNLAAEIETSLTPMELLARARQVEAALGRRRGGGDEARTIDIDIVLYGELALETPALRIPHRSPASAARQDDPGTGAGDDGSAGGPLLAQSHRGRRLILNHRLAGAIENGEPAGLEHQFVVPAVGRSGHDTRLIDFL